MYSVIRPWLFRMDPEQAHSLTLAAIRLAGQLPPVGALLRRLYAAPDQPVEAFGLALRNPVGLAAGYDKDGLGWRGLAALGFGHIEIGTVTPLGQPGNPRPRVFRLPQDKAVINRMGFPGSGAAYVAANLAGSRPGGLVLGVNIGKNKDTPLERALDDYQACLRVFAPLADYIAINVSSPNTAGLRRLQARDTLEHLLRGLAAERRTLLPAARRPGSLPILVKLAPDLEDEELEDALAAIQSAGMDGVIATNTTLARHNLVSAAQGQAGGLSGAPLTARSREMVAEIVRQVGSQLPVVGVGGVMSRTDAQAMLEAGARLVQVYTGLIYAGPGLVKQILSS